MIKTNHGNGWKWIAQVHETVACLGMTCFHGSFGRLGECDVLTLKPGKQQTAIISKSSYKLLLSFTCSHFFYYEVLLGTAATTTTTTTTFNITTTTTFNITATTTTATTKTPATITTTTAIRLLLLLPLTWRTRRWQRLRLAFMGLGVFREVSSRPNRLV